MDNFEEALHKHNQQPGFHAIYRFDTEVGINCIVDVVGSGTQAKIECDKRNERFAKVLGVYQSTSMHDLDPHGKYVATTELTVLKECRIESVRALRRPKWLRKLVESLDSWFVR